MALAIVFVVGPPRYDLRLTVPYLVLTFVQTALFAAYYPFFHRRLRRWTRRAPRQSAPWASPGAATRGLDVAPAAILGAGGRARTSARHAPWRDGRVLWAALDLTLSLVVVQNTGGLHSPFLVFGLTAVMFPALVFGWRGAVLAATAFVVSRLLAVAASGTGLEGVREAQQLDSLVAASVNVFLIALFSAYLASLLRKLDVERRRTARAWRETSALYAVAQSVLEGPAEVDALYERVVAAVRRHLRLVQFAVYVPAADGWRQVAGYGLPESAAAVPPGYAAAPLVVDGQEIGCLIGADRTGAPPQAEALLRALAGQVVLGLRNAALLREKAELGAASERARLAREIHDGVAQSLYMLTLNLEACAELAERGNGLRPRLEQLLGLARQALWEVRHYIFDLKPLLGGDAPLPEILRNPLREFQTIAGLPAELRSEGTERPLTPRARAAVYRVLQEGLANAFKHARASRVDVTLRWEGDGLTLEVHDDGRGFDAAAAQRGNGLDNLTQWAAETGGRASLESVPGEGTLVRLHVPYAVAEADPHAR
jgi:signal transduction histidine kinase